MHTKPLSVHPERTLHTTQWVQKNKGSLRPPRVIIAIQMHWTASTRFLLTDHVGRSSGADISIDNKSSFNIGCCLTCGAHNYPLCTNMGETLKATKKDAPFCQASLGQMC